MCFVCKLKSTKFCLKLRSAISLCLESALQIRTLLFHNEFNKTQWWMRFVFLVEKFIFACRHRTKTTSSNDFRSKRRNWLICVNGRHLHFMPFGWYYGTSFFRFVFYAHSNTTPLSTSHFDIFVVAHMLFCTVQPKTLETLAENDHFIGIYIIYSTFLS